MLHDGQAAGVVQSRQKVLQAAYAAHPERFVRGVPMIRSQRPFKFGDAFGNEFVRTPRDFSLSVKSFENLLSLSCMTIEGFSSRPAV